MHNDYYAGDKQRAEELRKRLEEVKKQLAKGGKDKPTPPPALPAGWKETRTDKGQVYYLNVATNETSWEPPGA